MDLISREAAIEALSRGEGCGHVCRNAIKRIPSVPAVPLDELCEMFSKSNVNVPCNEDCEGCEAFDGTGDTVNCWKITLTKWMEEQDAAD